jgi:AcrR family transcriptional regulator
MKSPKSQEGPVKPAAEDTKSKSHTAYHHGRLRDALLAAALDILEKDGLEALSLRKIATAVGVSHAAPSHHFPTLRHLLTGLASIGFTRFDQAMRSARESAVPDPAEQMRATESAYLAFATGHPALFRLMFTATLINWEDPELIGPARAARAQLTEICLPAAKLLGMHTPQQRAALERLVWSQIHGQAHLDIEHQFDGGDGSDSGEPVIDLAGLLFNEPGRRPT